MSQDGQPLQIIDHKMELVKYDPEDKTQWVWQAEATVLNLTSNYQQMGVSEAWFLLRHKGGVIGNYDSFGRTKAMSKAQRNANSVHIPKAMKKALYETSTPQNTKIMYLSGSGDDGNGGGGDSNTPKLPTDKQLNYLRGLKWTYTMPDNVGDAGDLITALKAHGVDVVQADKRWAHLIKATASTTLNADKPTPQQMRELNDLGYVGDDPFSEMGASVIIARLRKAKTKPKATTTKKGRCNGNVHMRKSTPDTRAAD